MSNRARALVAAVALSSLALSACGTRVHGAGSQQPSGGSSASAPATVSSGNTASDTGVTSNSIKIGIMGSLSSGLGPDVFSGPAVGAQTYFKALNAQGGINGRQVQVVTCDDGGDAAKNTGCAHTLIDDGQVFALDATTTFNYSAAPYVSSKGVPDVGGEPVTGNAYNQYPGLYSIYGGFGYPRDGKQVGYNGTQVSNSADYRWFKEHLGVKTAGIVYFSIGPSQAYADEIAKGLQNEGIQVVYEPINLALQDWTTAVLDMKRKGVQAVYDALTSDANVQLCKAIQAQGMPLKAKITTTQSLTDDSGATYAATPTCLQNLYAVSSTENYNNVANPQVQAYRSAIQQYAPQRMSKLNQWTFEGYLAAMWLSDAMKSCGSNLTRKCVTNFMNTQSYDANGLMIPRDFKVVEPAPKTQDGCLNVVRWSLKAPTGVPGWTSQTADMDKNCYTTSTYSFTSS
jgi:branched-chain amino acid transport system substrate-binding protein